MSQNKIQLAEKRSYSLPFLLEKRAKDGVEVNVITGYALKFNTRSHPLGWGFRETVHQDALKNTDLSNVICRAYHDDKYILGRTSNGTLSLTVDAVGLKYECELPNTTAAADVRELIERGDIAESSFEFWIRTDSWGIEADGTELRTILDISVIYDVSPVPRAAYPDTSVAKRSYDSAKQAEASPVVTTTRRNIANKILKTL